MAQSLEPELWPELWSQLECDDIAQSQKASAAAEERPRPDRRTAAQQEQVKYSYLTQYGTQILCLFSPQDGCLYVSQNFDALTGQSAQAQCGEAFFALVHADYRNKLRALVAAPLPETPAAQTLRCKLRHGDGKYYWYQLTVHSNAREYVCIAENINDHMLTQNTLQKAKLEAELALRARSEFLANMSHDLRTPLNAVIGFSEMIEGGTFGALDVPQYRDYVRHIHESGYDLLGKIEDLLEIANIDAGRVKLSREEVALSTLIGQVMAAQTHHAQAAGVALHYVPRGDIALFVDRLKLKHIIGHVVANAVKFSPKGAAVSIEVARAQQGGLQLTVRDSGTGMSDAQCRDIREALQQESCWTAKNSHSIGIGLALTKEFIALHGGQVAIDSSAGMGTAVTLTLPRDCLRVAPSRPALAFTAEYGQAAHG